MKTSGLFPLFATAFILQIPTSSANESCDLDDGLCANTQPDAKTHSNLSNFPSQKERYDLPEEKIEEAAPLIDYPADAKDFKPSLKNAYAKRAETLQIDQRISGVTRAGFTRDFSNPALGMAAYREPDRIGKKGLVWGSVVKDAHNQPLLLLQEDAKAYCECKTEHAIQFLGCIGKPGSARLPGKQDFERLRKLLGYSNDFPGQYSPYQLNGRTDFSKAETELKTDVLPELSKYELWSSSKETEWLKVIGGKGSAFADELPFEKQVSYLGGNGEVISKDQHLQLKAFRCVADSK